MLKTFFHGTSEDNLDSIVKNGFRYDQPKIWTASLNEVYFWSPDRLVESGNAEPESAYEFAKQSAFDSAQMALPRAKSGRCVVFEVEIDDEEMSDDFSCENMGGAVATSRIVPPSAIKRIYISEDFSLIRGYFIGQALNLSLFDSSVFTDMERKVGELFAKSDFDISLVYDSQLRQIFPS